jgi:integrase
LLHFCCSSYNDLSKIMRSEPHYTFTSSTKLEVPSMASICKRGDFQYQVIIRKAGYPSKTKTFETKRDAQVWASIIESEMNRGEFLDRRSAERLTLEWALERYLAEITPEKKSAKSEAITIKRWLLHPLAKRTVASLTSEDFDAHSAKRKLVVKASSVRIELAVISNLFTVMKKTWKINVKNPILDVNKKGFNSEQRERRLDGEEEMALLKAAHSRQVGTPYMGLTIILAIETGMRAGELVNLTWDKIDFSSRIATLPVTKNGKIRKVPLSHKAINALRFVQAYSYPPQERVMNFYDSNGLSASFRRVCARAEITGLRFHDLRHEAASRMASRMKALTLAKIMGWKTLQMAMRYYQTKDEELVLAIDGKL